MEVAITMDQVLEHLKRCDQNIEIFSKKIEEIRQLKFELEQIKLELEKKKK